MYALVLAALSAAPSDGSILLEKGVDECQDRGFVLPVKFSPATLTDIHCVVIYVSEDRGKTWKHCQALAPEDREVDFKAAHDGLYWFALQTIRPDGKAAPADPTDLTPARKVYVNSQRRAVRRQSWNEEVEQEIDNLRNEVEGFRKLFGELENGSRRTSAVGRHRIPDTANSEPLDSENQHRVAIRIEPILSLHGKPIRRPHPLQPRERRHQQQQARPRQMEVRHQRIHHSERRTAAGSSGPSSRTTAATARPPVLPSPARAPTWCPPPRHGGRRALHAATASAAAAGNLAPLRLDAVLRHVLRRHRLERAGPDVQRDEGPLDAALSPGVEQARREVQPRRRRGHGAGLTGVDRLVALAVGRARRGPCGCTAATASGRTCASSAMAWPALSGRANQRPDADLPTSAQPQRVRRRFDGVSGSTRMVSPISSRPRVWRQQLPRATAFLAQEETLPLAAGAGASADQPRRQHARVVQHQQVAGVQQRRQVAEEAVRSAASRRGAPPSGGTGRARPAVPGRSAARAGRSRTGRCAWNDESFATGAAAPRGASAAPLAAMPHLNDFNQSSNALFAAATVSAGPTSLNV